MLGFFKKLGRGIQIANQITNTPLVSMVLAPIPVVGNAIQVIHAAETLFPKPKSGEQKKSQAIAALKALHPEFDADTLSSLIDVMVKVTTVTP